MLGSGKDRRNTGKEKPKFTPDVNRLYYVGDRGTEDKDQRGEPRRRGG